MAEWSKTQHWKCCVGVTLPWVRIPLSPPFDMRMEFAMIVLDSLIPYEHKSYPDQDHPWSGCFIFMPPTLSSVAQVRRSDTLLQFDQEFCTPTFGEVASS